MANEHVNRARDLADQAGDQGQLAAREVRQSPVYRAFVQIGLMAYGVVHLLVAWLAFSLAIGRGGGGDKANQSGALQMLVEKPYGKVLLAVITAGFAMLVVWQVVQLLIGHREYTGGKKTQKRISSAARAIVYAALAWASVKGVMSGNTDANSQADMSQKLMSMPGGRILVGVVGLAVIGYAVYQFIKGYKGLFNEDLDRELTGPAKQIASAGFYAKGVAYGMLGVLFLLAAIRYDTKKAGGLDVALAEILKQPWGPIILGVVALGIAIYGVFCFYWARHAKEA